MSTLKADTIQNTSGGAATLTKQSAAKAWASADDSSGTDSVRDSVNVSSLTDTAQGDTTINFTSNMSNDDFASMFCAEASSGNDTNLNAIIKYNSITTSTLGGQSGNTSGTLGGLTSHHFLVHGDLA